MTQALEFRVLSDQELAAIRTKLVESSGDVNAAGLTLQDVRNAIYTRAHKVNPNVEAGQQDTAEAKPKLPKAKSKPQEIKGTNMDGLLG